MLLSTSNRTPQRQVRISEVVNNDDGTKTPLKNSRLDGDDRASDLHDRIEAYRSALGPATYTADQQRQAEVRGQYLNDVPVKSMGDSPKSMSESYKPYGKRRHSTPRKTSSKST